ncbi:MAG: sigma-70 family RNA polymerase sigma factor [Clostridiales bacterium]|nr:sigma-70 family RNA polymerase sigma factor [Clostridiales bacterium]
MQSDDMKTCSDEALAKLSRNGNREAENELVVRALPTVKFLVGTFSSTDNSVGEDDFIQEALLGVLSAINSYNPERGASFMTFASRCALNRLLSFIKKTSAHSLPVVGLDILSTADSSVGEPDEQIEADESYKKFIQSIRDSLTETELKVLNCYLRGLSYDKISLETGLSLKAVDNALFRARKKIKALR